MADIEDSDEPYKDIDIDTLWSKVQKRPLRIGNRKSVLLAPEFLQRLKGEETVNEGGDLTLTFEVNGVPKPTLRWFKDDEELKDHPRLTVEEQEAGLYKLTLHQANKGDEAAYRCRAENPEGASSCCFFLTVQGKPKSSKKGGHKRTVSFPTMFSTIIEKVEEEEKAGMEASVAPASPLSHFYDSLTVKGRASWPSFLGDWAFVNGSHKARGGSAPPEDRPAAIPAREARAISETRTTSTSGKLKAGRATTCSSSSPHKAGSSSEAAELALKSLKRRTLCFFSKPRSNEPSEAELYRRMLIAHRRKLRHVERADLHH